MTLTEHRISDHDTEHPTIVDVVTQGYDDDPNRLLQWSDDNLKVGEVNGQRYRYVHDTPKGWSGNTVITQGEFANGLHAGLILRSLVLRHAIDPNSALMISPQQTLFSKGQNFSREERKRLASGDMLPAIDRIRKPIEAIGQDGLQILYGPSQVATILTEYAAHPETTSNATLAIVEPPNIVDRSRTQLVKDFGASGNFLRTNIEANFDPSKSGAIREHILQGIGLKELALYGIGGARAQNRAMGTAMSAGNLHEALVKVLARGIPVVHAWGEHGALSPDKDNEEIANEIIRLHQPRHYAPIRIIGESADLSVTNLYALNAELVRKSVKMLNR